MSEGNAKIKTMNRSNEARRKAESKELFRLMLKSPHLVQLPKKYKGSRQSTKRKAINDNY
jgi:hypothetical protein